MSLRDLVMFAVLAWLVVRVPSRPYVGALAWVVFGVMNPHRLTWGYAYDFPFAQVIALLTLLGILLSKEHRRPKGGVAVAIMLAILGWNAFCTLFAFNPDPALDYVIRIAKIFAMTLVLLLLIHDRKEVEQLLWALVLSLGFYGVKGGIFVMATGGAFMVNGPPGSVMEGNNSLGVGLVIVIPLMYYLFRQTTSGVVRIGLIGAMSLCAISVLGSYSRGALLAILAMGGLLWLRSQNKIVILAAAGVFVMLAIPAMPEQWTARMNTMKTYEQDGSAMGRLVAWETAYNIAADRFPVAGGLEWHGEKTSMRYSPVRTLFLVAHSIYFQVLGSSGFIGLVLILSFWATVWLHCVRLRRLRGKDPGLEWAAQLGSMVQVSLTGYLVGGAFLDLAYWDLPYYLFAAVIGARYAVQFEARRKASAPPGNGIAVGTKVPPAPPRGLAGRLR